MKYYAKAQDYIGKVLLIIIIKFTLLIFLYNIFLVLED